MDSSVDGWSGEYVCAFGKAMAYENCVVLLASAVSRSPTLLKGNGYLLRSRRFLCFGTQLCRAPAGGGVVTLLDVPWVTVPSPDPTRRAALVTRPGLPQFRGGGLSFLPG